MLRLALPTLVLIACDWTTPDTGGSGVRPLPDAYVGCVGAFHIVAPNANLHYDKSLEVYIDESEAQGDLQLTMTDDLGTPYTWTTETFGTDPDGMYWSRDRYHYDLAAGHRYDLAVTHCNNAAIQTETVTFFTSP